MSINAQTAPASSAEVKPRWGSAAAAMISAGIGCALIGLFTSIAEGNAGFKDWLNCWNPAGPLTGKTGLGVIVWLVSWLVLWLLWRNKERNLRTAFIIMIVLIVVGLLLTLPPIFEAFAAE